jgi:AcrR family transcriptional regulator
VADRTAGGSRRDRVVAEGAAVADEVGLDGLTLAAVAERLEVRVPSLYKHVAGLDDLRRGISVLGTRQLGDALGGAAMGRAGGDALRAVAGAYRRFATHHPGRYAATVRAPSPDDGEHLAAAGAVLAVVLAVLDGYGLEGDDAVDAARALRSTLHGFAALEQAGGFGLPRDVDRSFERTLDALDSALAAWPGSAT